MLKAREAVYRLKTYHPPLGNRDGLRLDFNENTVGCSPRVLAKIRSLDGEQLARYPEREPLEACVASYLKVDANELLLTNGTDEAIHLICETYLEPQAEVLIVVPTFAMYEIYAAATGATVIPIPTKENFEFATEEVMRRINSRTRLIAVANPNNPTGTLVPQKELLEIVKAAPQAAVLIDEAYFEFCQQTLIPRWREFSNLFVSRTFSKAYGLAGLRIGVLMGDAEQMSLVRRVSSPYSVNEVALACLPEALGDGDYVTQYAAEVRRGRDQLEQQLRTFDIRHWPSQANFVLMHFGSRNTAFIAAMRDRRILVRDRSSDYGCKGCVRITLGSAAHNEQLFAALREVLDQIGLAEKVSR
ncbi:MAG: histidinol phosphate aminotransferase apoenzyme [Acidobacteriaceae bacterium]|nr:histidinol phosphate aminotransferase apoenzyme [Acidobacteriaceae bacterium]